MGLMNCLAFTSLHNVVYSSKRSGEGSVSRLPKFVDRATFGRLKDLIEPKGCFFTLLSGSDFLNLRMDAQVCIANLFRPTSCPDPGYISHTALQIWLWKLCRASNQHDKPTFYSHIGCIPLHGRSSSGCLVECGSCALAYLEELISCGSSRLT